MGVVVRGYKDQLPRLPLVGAYQRFAIVILVFTLPHDDGRQLAALPILLLFPTASGAHFAHRAVVSIMAKQRIVV